MIRTLRFHAGRTSIVVGISRDDDRPSLDETADVQQAVRDAWANAEPGNQKDYWRSAIGGVREMVSMGNRLRIESIRHDDAPDLIMP